MAPLREDPSEWEAVMRALRAIIDWMAASPFAAFALPALFGAYIGKYREYLRNNRRKVSKREFISSVLMSGAVGCGLTPLFAHIAGLPDVVATSLAFLLGNWGLRLIDDIQNALSSKVGIEDKHGNDDE